MRAGARRGSATIEFALSFAFLFSIFTGVFQFGYSYFAYNTLESAVRAAGRYASLHTYDSPTDTPSDAYLADVRNVAVYGNPAGAGQPVAPGLTPANVNVVMVMDRNVPYRVRVSITNYRIDAVFTSLTLNGKPSAAFQFLGRYAPST